MLPLGTDGRHQTNDEVKQDLLLVAGVLHRLRDQILDEEWAAVLRYWDATGASKLLPPRLLEVA